MVTAAAGRDMTKPFAGYRRAGFIGERGNLFGPDFPPRFPMLAVAVQRDRAANC